MKKIIINFLALLLVFVLCSCSVNTEAQSTTVNNFVEQPPPDDQIFFDYSTYQELFVDLSYINKGGDNQLNTDTEKYGDIYNKTIDWLASAKIEFLVPTLGGEMMRLRDKKGFNGIGVFVVKDKLPEIWYHCYIDESYVRVTVEYPSVLEDERIRSAETYVDVSKIINPNYPTPDNYNSEYYKKVYEKQITLASKDTVTAMIREQVDDNNIYVSYYADGVMVNVYADAGLLTDSFFSEFQLLDYYPLKTETVYTVLETLGVNGTSNTNEFNHREEIIGTDYFPFDSKQLAGFIKHPTPDNITVEIDDDVYEEACYIGSKRDYYINSESDIYKKDTEDIFLEVHKKADTGKIYYFICESAQLKEKHENAPFVHLKGGLDIAKKHFRDYIGSEEIANQFVFEWSGEGEEEYRITATRSYNDIKTYESVEYTVTNRGYIKSYYINVDTTMDITEAPTKSQMKLISDCRINKCDDEIYDMLSNYSVDFGEYEPVLVRLSDGTYAIEYNYPELVVLTDNDTKRQSDPTRMFVIIE